MQPTQLTINYLFDRAEKYHPEKNIITATATGIERTTSSFLSITHTHCNELLYTTRRPVPVFRGKLGANRRVSVMLGAMEGNGETSTPPCPGDVPVAESDPESCAASTDTLPT